MHNPTTTPATPSAISDNEQSMLRKLGFAPAPTEIPKRLIANLQGLPKTGKTTFALTAPPPIFYIDLDTGSEGVIERVKRQGKEILVRKIRIPRGVAKADYEQMWDGPQGVRALLSACWAVNQGTLIVDTGTELHELLRLARFGKLTEVRPHHYGPVNMEWKEFCKLAFDADRMNTIFVHKVKPVWQDEKRTSRYELAGYADMGYLCEISIEMRRRDQQETDDVEGSVEFGGMILNARKRADLLMMKRIPNDSILPVLDFSLLVEIANLP